MIDEFKCERGYIVRVLFLIVRNSTTSLVENLHGGMGKNGRGCMVYPTGFVTCLVCISKPRVVW